MSLPFLKSPVGEEPVVIEGTFRASASRLFRAWTTADELRQWFGPGDSGPSEVTVDAKVGGLWECVFSDDPNHSDILRGEYVEVLPDRRLVFTWRHIRTRPDHKLSETAMSLVTVEFEDVGHETRLRLVHEQIVSESGRLGVGGGWDSTFGKLQRFVAVETPSTAAS